MGDSRHWALQAGGLRFEPIRLANIVLFTDAGIKGFAD